MDTTEIVKQVTDELVKRGYQATFEYPGFVEVLKYGLRIDFGTANEFWGGDVYAFNHDGVVGTTVPSDSTDIKAIADALAAAVEACKPAAGSQLTGVGRGIFDAVFEAMQDAEELGGPEGDDYIALMEAIAQEATDRIANYRELLRGGKF